MDFNEVIYSRRSARLFTDYEVTKEQLETIIYSGSLAPSAKNRQPWKFYILNKKEKDNISKLLSNYIEKNDEEKIYINKTVQIIQNANKMLIIYIEKSDEIHKKPNYISLGCAIENMSLQTINLGLGSCIICDTLYIEDEIDSYLGIKNFEQMCGFVIGKPIYNIKQLQRKNLNDLILN